MAQTLDKSERLSGKIAISRLMGKGRWGSFPGFRFCCLAPNEQEKNRLIVSVPKKLFKRAVKRNLLKRRIREAYRTQKESLHHKDGFCDVLLQYNSSEIMTFEEIRMSIGSILNILSE